MKIKNNKAFTLIEILVVATIIGLLAAGGYSSYGAFTKQSRDARRKADIEQVRAAVEQYRSNVGTYPTSVVSGSSIQDSSNNVYMSKVPSDPDSAHYSYNFSVSANDYTICAHLEGKTTSYSTACAGGSDDATKCNYCAGPYGEVQPGGGGGGIDDGSSDGSSGLGGSGVGGSGSDSNGK